MDYPLKAPLYCKLRVNPFTDMYLFPILFYSWNLSLMSQNVHWNVVGGPQTPPALLGLLPPPPPGEVR